MAIQVEAKQSSYQVKLVANGKTITRTFSGLLPVGTVEQQAEGQAISLHGQGTPDIPEYNPADKTAYVDGWRAAYYDDTNTAAIMERFTSAYCLMYDTTAAALVSTTYNNQTGPTTAY